MSDTATNAADTSADLPAFLDASRSRPAAATVIGEHSNLVGDISVPRGQDLVIDGCVMGSIFHGGKVTVGNTGVVIGSIFAAELEVHGVVDAAEGEILTANLLVHGTSRIKATEVTVATGCMNYERGGYMSAQLAMLPAADVDARIEGLLNDELSKAAERRARLELARVADAPHVRPGHTFSQPARASASSAAAAPSALAAALGIPVAVPTVDDVQQLPVDQDRADDSAPRVAPQQRAHVALVPPVIDEAHDDDAEADDAQLTHRTALGG